MSGERWQYIPTLNYSAVDEMPAPINKAKRPSVAEQHAALSAAP
jgi:hypothetical protein